MRRWGFAPFCAACSARHTVVASLARTLGRTKTMSQRTNRLAAQLSAFVNQYGRKAQRGVEPNDRQYSREAEEAMKRLSPEELSAVLNSEADEYVPLVKPKNPNLPDFVPKKKGRGP